MALFVAALISLTIGAFESRNSTAAATAAWQPLRSANLERTEVGAGRIGRSIYVVGGFVKPSRTTAAAERYEIDRDRWRRIPNMPIAVNHPAVAVDAGLLYVYGGYSGVGFGSPIAALQRYDPATRRWKLLQTLADPPRRGWTRVVGREALCRWWGGRKGGRTNRRGLRHSRAELAQGQADAGCP